MKIKNKISNINLQDKDRFLRLTQNINDIQSVKKGIGTLSEKTLHSLLKNYYEEDVNKQEVKIGNYVADICDGNNIIEIQTRAFNKMRSKLEQFLKDYIVTIVYPIPYIKWLLWIDMDTGSVTNKRKSPKIGNIYDAIIELYKVKMFLDNDNLKIKLLFLNIEEYRYLNGWSSDKKRGSSRCNRIPIEIIEEVDLDRIADYKIFLSDNLPEEFNINDFQNSIKISKYVASLGLNILNYLKVIEVVGKQGRKNLYKRVNKKSIDNSKDCK